MFKVAYRPIRMSALSVRHRLVELLVVVQKAFENPPRPSDALQRLPDLPAMPSPLRTMRII